MNGVDSITSLYPNEVDQSPPRQVVQADRDDPLVCQGPVPGRSVVEMRS